MIATLYIKGFELFLQLEKNLSKNTIDAYIRDIQKLEKFASINQLKIDVLNPSNDFFDEFIKWLVKSGCAATSQARILSGIRSFYDYLVLEKYIDKNPTDLLEFPKMTRKLPSFLTITEIESLIQQIDASKIGGFRNKVILELLFACGLRVTELVNLKHDQVYFKEECILVTGKGNKQRLVPISKNALNLMKLYMETERQKTEAKPKDKEIFFLSRRGSRLSREFIFTMVKQLALKAGIRKNVSPHTFRHSFATSLITNGADLRAIQNMLGHESITTTEIYAHLDRKHLQKVVDQFHPRSKKQLK